MRPGDNIIGNENALVKFITFQDSVYAKDDMTDLRMKYKKFVSMKKGNSQPIHKFFAEYKKEYVKAKKLG